MEIEVLHRQGKSIREIERETGIARNTIRRVLRGEHEGQYGPRAPRPSILDPYKDYIRNRLRQAGPARLSSTVLHREVCEQGYTGGVLVVRRFMASIRPTITIEPIVRFETPPGKQLQVDFVVFRRGDNPLRAFTAELGFSRYAYVEFTDNERTETLIGCLERALQYFGGVPEQILGDNTKAIVLKRNAYGDGQHRLNPLLLDFAKHYGVKVSLCAPYRAQTKGKLERFHRYLRESFFVPLQTKLGEPVDVATANREVREWLISVAACRVHATLKERPIDRFDQERQSLRALPLPYGGHMNEDPSSAHSVPTPVESLQHPLSIYDAIAAEIAA